MAGKRYREEKIFFFRAPVPFATGSHCDDVPPPNIADFRGLPFGEPGIHLYKTIPV
jgi:hypothetical protein